MGDDVAWEKVEAWLKVNKAKVERSFGDDTTQRYDVTRGVGPFKKTTVLFAQSFSRERSDGSGMVDRTPFEVPGASIAQAAATLRIKDATQVLGANWKNKYPDQVAAEARNERMDEAEAKEDPMFRGRSGSLSEPPAGGSKEEYASGKRHGDGEVQ